MSLNEQIGADITAAMKAKDAPKLSALRMLKASPTRTVRTVPPPVVPIRRAA